MKKVKRPVPLLLNLFLMGILFAYARGAYGWLKSKRLFCYAPAGKTKVLPLLLAYSDIFGATTCGFIHPTPCGCFCWLSPVRPLMAGEENITVIFPPIPVFYVYAGVGFFIVLYAGKASIFNKRIELVKDKIRSYKRWQKWGDARPPAEKSQPCRLKQKKHDHQSCH